MAGRAARDTLRRCPVAELMLRSGHVLLFDEPDTEIVMAHTWYAWRPRSTGTYYAATTVRTGRRRPIVLLPELLIAPTPGYATIHINGHGLDCRRANLRRTICARSRAGCGVRVDNKSGYKGVSWYARTNKWVARIAAGGPQRCLGYFDDPWDAAQAYNAAALEAWGEFAYLNVRHDAPVPAGGA